MVYPRGLFAAAAVGLVAVAILSTGTPIAASVDPGNPVIGGRGFLVLVDDTAVLTSKAIDGALAVGGDVAIGGAFNLATQTAGTYTAPGDNVPSALVVGGKVTFEQSTQGAVLRVLHGYAKLGRRAGTFVRDLDSNGASVSTRILPADSYEATPRVELTVSQAPGSVGPSSPLPFGQIFADYQNRSRQLASCPNTVILRDSRDAPITSPIAPATNARVILEAGRTNVLNVTSTDLNNIAVLTFVKQPTASSPLLINVDTGDVEGDFGWRSPTFAGIGGEQARSILVNFPGALYLNHASGGSIEGTVFAPRAEFVDDNPSNVEGNIVAREFYMTSGEVHNFPFSAKLSCLPPAPSPSISPSASPAASPSASLTASPSASVSPSPSESARSESDPPSGSPSDSPSAYVGGTGVQISGVPLTLIAGGGSLLILVGLALLGAVLRRE